VDASDGKAVWVPILLMGFRYAGLSFATEQMPVEDPVVVEAVAYLVPKSLGWVSGWPTEKLRPLYLLLLLKPPCELQVRVPYDR